MELEWSLIHHNSHIGAMASEELLFSKESLGWGAVDNESWILKVSFSLQSYVHRF